MRGTTVRVRVEDSFRSFRFLQALYNDKVMHACGPRAYRRRNWRPRDRWLAVPNPLFSPSSDRRICRQIGFAQNGDGQELISPLRDAAEVSIVAEGGIAQHGLTSIVHCLRELSETRRSNVANCASGPHGWGRLAEGRFVVPAERQYRSGRLVCDSTDARTHVANRLGRSRADG